MNDDRVRVYVWEFPIRLTHWINFLSLIALSITGFYIGSPFIHAYSSEQYIMGWMRLIHFIVAYVFTMSVIVRVYWGMMGNEHAGFSDWFPFQPKQIKRILGGLKFYLFIKRQPSYTVGHTALAGFTYCFLFAIFIFEIISGFALYSVTHSGILWTVLGGWLVGVLHLQTIRLFHHLFMYAILLIAVFHIYVAWYLDMWERSGLIDSIFSGYKYVLKKDR